MSRFLSRVGPSSWDAWLARLFIAAFCVTQFAYSIVMIDPNDQKWFWIGVLATLSFIAMARRVGARREIRLDSIDLALAALLLYAVLSLAWAPDWRAAMLYLAKWGCAAAIFVYLKDFGSEELFRRLAAWTIFAAAMVLFLAYTQPGAAGGFHNRNFITEYLLIALPYCAAYLAIASSRVRRLGAALVIAILLWYLIFDNESRLEFAVLPGAAACGLAQWLKRRWGWRAVLACAFVTAVAAGATVAWWWEAPFAGGRGLNTSFLPRVALSLDTLLLWLDAPIFGHGAASFQYLFPLYQEAHNTRLDLQIALFEEKHLIAGAAHNEYLQFLGDFGLAGAALAGVLAWRVAVLARGGPAFGPMQYAALAAVLIAGVNSALEFPLQNPATLLIAVASVAILVANPRREGEAIRLAVNRAGALAGACACLAAAIGAQYLADRYVTASKNHFIANERLTKGDHKGSYEARRETVRLNPWDYQTRMGLFLAAVLLVDAESWSKATMVEQIRSLPLLSGEINTLYTTASSAGWQPSVLFARVYYLVRSGHYQAYPAEVPAALAAMRKYASRIPDIWLLDAACGRLFGDPEQVSRARAAAERTGMAPHRLESLRRLEALAQAESGQRTAPADGGRLEAGLPPPDGGLVRRADTGR